MERDNPPFTTVPDAKTVSGNIGTETQSSGAGGYIRLVRDIFLLDTHGNRQFADAKLQELDAIKLDPDRMIGLMQAIDERLNQFPEQTHRAIRLRYNLDESKNESLRSYSHVARNLPRVAEEGIGVSKQRAREVINRALRQIYFNSERMPIYGFGIDKPKHSVDNQNLSEE